MLTFCPPGPDERTARQERAAAGPGNAGGDRDPASSPGRRVLAGGPFPGTEDRSRPWVLRHPARQVLRQRALLRPWRQAAEEVTSRSPSDPGRRRRSARQLRTRQILGAGSAHRSPAPRLRWPDACFLKAHAPVGSGRGGRLLVARRRFGTRSAVSTMRVRLTLSSPVASPLLLPLLVGRALAGGQRASGTVPRPRRQRDGARSPRAARSLSPAAASQLDGAGRDTTFSTFGYETFVPFEGPRRRAANTGGSRDPRPARAVAARASRMATT